MRGSLTLLILFLLFSGCAQDISSLDLNGNIDGQEWWYAEGEAWADASVGGYRVELFPEYYSACFASATPSDRVALTIPSEVGIYDLEEGAFTVTFVTEEADGDVNYEAIKGTLEIGSMDENGLTAGLFARHSNEFEVDGQFEIGICIP